MFWSENESPFAVMTFKLELFTIVHNEKRYSPGFRSCSVVGKKNYSKGLQVNRLISIRQNTVTSEFRFQPEI
jgi:hypothetical protein